jgi:hypothetical protein
MMNRSLTTLLLFALLSGCHAAHDPQFTPGEGAVTGQLLNSEKAPFNLTLAGDDGAKALRIELHSASGTTAVTYPRKEKSRFTFNHVPPGQYELSVYTAVPGKRTIAGSTPVTVDPGKVTPVNVTLTVTPIQG